MEHIHIISAGESIHKTFPKAVNDFKMDKAIVIVEDKVFSNPNFGHNSLILDSINELKRVANVLDKSVEVKYIPTLSLEDIRNAVLEIFDRHSNSTFYFNITGGTKILSNGLFMMSIWIDGITYYVDENNSLQILNVPKIRIENVEKNINYIIILEILSTHRDGIFQKDLFAEMKGKYIPVREESPKSKRNLSRGTLSKWLHYLSHLELVSMYYSENNQKEKKIKITSNGTFALKFIRVAHNKNINR